jgi:hypothetical protein
MKAHLRKLGPRSLRSLTADVRAGPKLFSPAECAADLRHAGYDQTKSESALVEGFAAQFKSAMKIGVPV